MKKLLIISSIAIAGVLCIAATHNEYEGWFGVTPVAQQTGPDRASLQNYGLIASDGTTTASATSGAATLSKVHGVITSEALTTAAAATYTLTLTNTLVASTSEIGVTVGNGTNTTGVPVLSTITPGTGSAVIVVQNNHASAAFNGTLKIAFSIR
jgi:hypothetical protein